ncbi:U-box domain-containing protein 4-like isoform X1 [Zingiber officinale]|uniref:U-box domain-containing protein 4-like isoform X1 n=1 Tax=Zingiber officinale TaxID=94328 RepID=UPI001C4C48CD|nr:U-box domain-containing protein 4-like isoform X1 [Zingiber officinale]
MTDTSAIWAYKPESQNLRKIGFSLIPGLTKILRQNYPMLRRTRVCLVVFVVGGHRERFGQEQGSVVGACVEALGASSPELKRAATTGIRLLAKHRSNFRALIRASGSIPALVPLLKSIAPAMQESAMTALLNLSLEEENKKPITTAGAKQNAACALLSLSMIEENRGTIGACGAIPPLVSLLVSDSSRGKNDSLTTLYKLCSVWQNKERAISAGAVPPLVGLVGERSDGTAEKALVVLGSLAAVPEDKDAVAEAGGIPVLVEAMEIGPTAGREFVVHVLLQLAAESPHIQRFLLGEGAIPPLVELSQAAISNGNSKKSIPSRFQWRH